MNIKTIVNTAMLTSLLFGAICQADTSSEGQPTGKRQHKPITVVKPIDKATPALYKSAPSSDKATPALYDDAASSSKTSSSQKSGAAYRLCPDGTMIHPGEKCPEKSAKRK